MCLFKCSQFPGDDDDVCISVTSTILVEPCCEASLTEGGDVCIAVGSDPHCALGTELNAVQLSIFSHRFMSIAGQQTLSSDPFRCSLAHLHPVPRSQSRWAEFSNEPPSLPILRSALISPVPCLDPMAAWCPTRLTSPSTWVPCRRPFSIR